MAYETAVSGAHSIHEGQTVLFYDYMSAIEESEKRVQKVVRSTESLSLGRIGAQAKEEFLAEQEGQMFDDNIDNELDDE